MVLLKDRALVASIWSMMGFGLSQFIRLAGNLILTRIFAPEVFGLMALVNIVIHGVNMFSDVGINTSVIRDKRGDQPDYVATAWTLQVIRGVFI